jgi:hypothetical protein
MAKCGACGATGLKKTTVAFVIEKGRIVGRRVGNCCAKDGVTIVTTRIAPIVQSSERKNQKEVLQPFIETLLMRLRIRRANAPPDSLRTGHTSTDIENAEIRAEHQGYSQALEDVIAMLKEGRT